MSSPWGGSSWGLGGVGGAAFGPGPAVLKGVPVPVDELRRLFGRDLFWDGDYKVSPSGDWLVVEGREALRQALVRRMLTSPGEFATRPEYGVGARAFLKARRTTAAVNELSERIKEQFVRDPRVDRVELVDVESNENGVVKISAKVIIKGQTQRTAPLIASVEVT